MSEVCSSSCHFASSSAFSFGTRQSGSDILIRGSDFASSSMALMQPYFEVVKQVFVKIVGPHQNHWTSPR